MVFAQQVNGNGNDAVSRFGSYSPVGEDGKSKARKLGLWNILTDGPLLARCRGQ
jgi:hypothetical protein